MDPVTPRSRRAILAGALGGVAAAAASSLIRPSTASATDDSPLVVGQVNSATLATTLDRTATTGPTFMAISTGTNSSGIAVRAAANGPGYGVYATSATGTGALASSTSGLALRATSGGQAAAISSTSSTKPSLVSQSTGGTVGVVGLGASFVPAAYPSGVGVLGDNPNSAGVGVWGRSTNGTAVLGEGDTGYGVEAYGAVGVYGSGGAVGILGDVDHATGVQGWSGVDIAPDSGIDVGVWAGAEPGRTALQTQGVVRMNRSGRTLMAIAATSKKVTIPGGIDAASSLGFANLQTNRAGFYVQAVAMGAADSSITIYLNKALTAATYVSYVVLDIVVP
jgi:hypothetical protein